MSKSAEFWNCLYYTELLLQPIFNELSALAVEVSCFLKLTSTDFSPREKKLRSEKKLRQKIRSLLLVVLLLKKPKHFARKKKQHQGTQKRRRRQANNSFPLLLLLLLSATAAVLFQFLQFCSFCLGKYRSTYCRKRLL